MVVVLIVGLSVGSIYGLLAMGIVLTYRTSGVYNLAHGAMGLFGTVIYYKLVTAEHWHVVPAALLSILIVGPATGLIAYLFVYRWVTGRPIAIILVATIAVLGAFSGFAIALLRGGTTSVTDFPELFPRWSFKLPGNYTVLPSQLGSIVITAAVATLLLWYLYGTRFGLKTRACVDRAELTELVGESTARIQLVSWIIGATVATLSVILVANVSGLTPILLTLLVIQASAAAVIGRLASLPLTYAGGVGLGILEALLARYLPANATAQGLRISAAFILLYAVLVLGATLYRGFGALEVSEELHGLRREAADATRLAPVVVLVIAIACVYPLLSSYLQFLVTAGLIASIMFQGFILVTGLGGQVSLASAAFMGIGAILYARLTGAGVPIAVAFLGAVAVAVLFGLAVGLPATRIRGLPLALLTFAFSLFMDRFAFLTRAFGSQQGFTIGRFRIFGWDLNSRTQLAYFVLVLAFGTSILVRNMATGRTGRILTAVSNSDVAVESFGASSRQVKLLLFCFAAALASIAGILLAVQVQVASATQFDVSKSILFLTLAVVGGISNPQGAIVAGLLLYGIPDVFANLGLERLYPPVFAVLTIVVIAARRGGLADGFSRPVIYLTDLFGRASILGAVEQRGL